MCISNFKNGNLTWIELQVKILFFYLLYYLRSIEIVASNLGVSTPSWGILEIPVIKDLQLFRQ